MNTAISKIPIGECINKEIIQFLNNFVEEKIRVNPVLIFPPSMGKIFLKNARYMAALYNLVGIYIGNGELKTVVIMRFHHLKQLYSRNFNEYFSYADEDCETINTPHSYEKLQQTISSNLRKKARRTLWTFSNPFFVLDYPLSKTETMLNRTNEQDKPTCSEGTLNSSLQHTNVSTEVSLINSSNNGHNQVHQECDLFQSLEPNLPQSDLYQPISSEMKQDIEHLGALSSQSEFVEEENSTSYNAEPTETDIEIMQLQNLGASYEKEYGCYMYDSSNILYDKELLEVPVCSATISETTNNKGLLNYNSGFLNYLHFINSRDYYTSRIEKIEEDDKFTYFEEGLYDSAQYINASREEKYDNHSNNSANQFYYEYDLFTSNLPKRDWLRPKSTENEQNIEHFSVLPSQTEFVHEKKSTSYNPEPTETDIEMIQIQNLGAPYEKEYGWYMYDGSNVSYDKQLLESPLYSTLKLKQDMDYSFQDPTPMNETNICISDFTLRKEKILEKERRHSERTLFSSPQHENSSKAALFNPSNNYQFPPLPPNLPQSDLHQPISTEMEQGIGHFSALLSQSEFLQEEMSASYNPELIKTDTEIIQLQNLGAPYEKEYGQYMYDNSTLLYKTKPLETPVYRDMDYAFANITLLDQTNTPPCDTDLLDLSSLSLSETEEHKESSSQKSAHNLMNIEPNIDISEYKCVINKPPQVIVDTSDKWIATAISITKDYAAQVDELVEGTALLVLASENYCQYRDQLQNMDYIIELHSFPSHFRTHNILRIYKKEPRYLKWCDDTHALLITGSAEQDTQEWNEISISTSENDEEIDVELTESSVSTTGTDIASSTL
ncbi:hypothetical protein FQA39_LY15041 [Lamprigera yunnana]|nr:hypothetical protein FQA39_LY15041 [Lamprigera yunnana]